MVTRAYEVNPPSDQSLNYGFNPRRPPWSCRTSQTVGAGFIDLALPAANQLVSRGAPRAGTAHQAGVQKPAHDSLRLAFVEFQAIP